MNKSFFLSIGFLAFLTCTYGQTKQDKQLEKILDNFLSTQFKPSDPGCEILVAKKGAVVYKKAFGNANMELNVPIRTDMVFNLASVTKQFTAVGILQLVEQSKILLSDSLQKFIPDFPSKGYTITIENLLTHTSGIRDYMQIDYANLYMERWDFKPKQLIDSFKNYALEFDPGTKFSYSNSGYYLLGYIIQKVSGQSYQSYIQNHLLKPLGLSHTYFDSSSIIIPNRVNGYRKEEDVFKNVDYWSPTIEYAAGGLISNVDDLFKWHKGLYSYQILKKETIQKAFIPYLLKDGTATGYGYGWFLKTSNGIKSIEHEGGIPGFKSNVIYFPAEDIFIAALFNCGTVPVDDLSNTISSIALGKPLQMDLKVDTKILDEYEGVYQLTIDNSRTITMRKENNQLIAEVSKTEKIPILFQSETNFQFKNLLDANCEFIKEKGKVTRFNVSQNGHFTWVKIQ
jgi:CubicO group peptidase (beta-lactamase class C family)